MYLKYIQAKKITNKYRMENPVQPQNQRKPIHSANVLQLQN